MTETDWVPRQYRALVATSRPVKVQGEDHLTTFTVEALESVAKSIREGFVPATVEHLTFLPPIARWFDAEIVTAEDGAHELIAIGRDLRQFVARDEGRPDPIGDVEGLALPSGRIDQPRLRVGFEDRNFDADSLSLVEQESPLPTDHEMRWSALPPIEWALYVPVVWGAVKFLGAFFDELGRSSARHVADWIRRASSRAKEPERDRLLTVIFEVALGKSVYAIVPLKRDDPDEQTIVERALNSLGPIASLAGLIREGAAPLPDVQRAAFIYDGSDWRFAWWTDGDGVYRTRWFEEHMPDPTRFLGRPLFDQKS